MKVKKKIEYLVVTNYYLNVINAYIRETTLKQARKTKKQLGFPGKHPNACIIVKAITTYKTIK